MSDSPHSYFMESRFILHLFLVKILFEEFELTLYRTASRLPIPYRLEVFKKSTTEKVAIISTTINMHL